MSKIFCVIYNPISGNGKSHYIVKYLQKDLNNNNIQYKVYKSDYSGHIKDLCLNKKFNNFIVIGGDGTFNEAINGFMNRNNIDNITVGFLPGGTGNSFMHDLNAKSYQKAIKKILHGRSKKIDVLKLNMKSNNGKQNTKYSLNIVGWGLVSDINILADKLRFLGGIRYNIASLYYIFNKKIRKAKVTIDQIIKKKNYLFVMCLNTIHTGKGMKAAPDAKLDDGLLDIIILNANISKIQLLRLLPKLFTGKHIYSKKVDYLQAKSLEINSESKDMLNIDGENKYYTPISITVIPKAINIFC